ncbi:unnamed protein product [Euphydryas editha]|uniref:Protein ELYS n=1 Tax=Euphydryas editha TaxID=104508 RepID=A0AAU9TUT4_EUPED|nr:unnamed protein product [Euphydryas editha]
MQKLQESVFSIVKTTSLSSAVFSFLQPTEDYLDKTPLGGILRDTKYAWLALGPKFCVVDLRSGLKIAARTFGNGISSRIHVTSVVELPTPLTDNSQQLIISLECDETTSLICVFHINGSQLLRCIQTDIVITELAVCDGLPSGPLMCFDGLVMAGTRKGEIIIFDLNRASLIKALKDISQGYERLVRGENNVANIIFLPLKAVNKIESQRDLAFENDDHLALLINEDSFIDGQYIFHNPDGTVRMKAKQSHIRVTVLQYIPQLGSLVVGFNFGAFQIWNTLNLKLEFTSQVNVECLPVTHFGFQEPCDDPRAFCYLWVVFSVLERFVEEEYPLAVMYSLTYQGKRMLSDTKCLYQGFSMATIRFQIELSAIDNISEFIGGRCISCHTFSVSSTLGEEGEDTMLNLCQLVWECWGENKNTGIQHAMLLFDLDQWYKDQMPATQRIESNAFMSTSRCPDVNRGSCLTLDLRLDPTSVSPYSHATRLEEHFYPNSLQYDCVWLNTSETSVIHTVGVQRQIVRSISAAGPACLLGPAALHAASLAAGLAPLYCDAQPGAPVSQEDQRRFILSVALEARLSRFLKRCAHDWAAGTHSGVGCTLTFLVDWSWKRAIELKENAKELTAPLFTSSTLPDRNVVRCLEHCVQQLTQLTGLLDAILTKCCNLVVPDALSEMEEKYKGIGTVSLYFQVVQWFVRVGLLPERLHSYNALPYPAHQLQATYNKRRVKLNRLQGKSDDESTNKSCPLLYIDQLIEHEFGGDRVHQMWIKAGSDSDGLYPPPSLYALLRLYLLPDIAEEHKHSLLLYLLLDYSMLYDDMRYEAVIRRLMQFPTMFGLSNTAIKATQAFWHLDHRDFDFALDQLQCLTGNTLSDWQHHVVLSSLLAQKKTQAALQYLHVRKPAPIQNVKHGGNINDHDKLDDWQSCCDLYLARGLVFEALDVIRMCVQNASSVDDKEHLLNFFYKGCRNTGQLSKVLQVTLLPFEEEVFIKYLKDCNEPQTSDILVMYYLQQARYLEAERYNEEIKSRGGTSADSARDALVELLRAALPPVAGDVARVALAHEHTRVIKAKPMTVYVQATSPKNTFTYKSTFIQDTIENASETWINKPKMKKGLKRALNIEETPFICTPKLYKTKSILNSEQKGSEATPPKRAKLDFSGTPKTPKAPCTLKVSETLSQEMASLLDMPEVESPHKHDDRSGAETPHSILKNRRLGSLNRDAPSPADSRYLDSDEELDAASDHTHCSDSNKLLRFTIPTASEAGSTPSPVPVPVTGKDLKESPEKHMDYESDKRSHNAILQAETHPMESPPKKFAAEGGELKHRKSYKDNVRARKSLSISANSSLSDDPNTSIESIADIPITLINPRYTRETRYSRASPIHSMLKDDEDTDTNIEEKEIKDIDIVKSIDSAVPRTPKSRRSIRSGVGESTPLAIRSRPTTPERQDSPITTLRVNRITRSRSRTPELSPRSSLAAIPEQSPLDVASEPAPARDRSRTPEVKGKVMKVLSQLEAIAENPKPSESPSASPSRRSLRSRSRTPEVEVPEQPVVTSPRSLRSRSKTPEKLMSPKKEHSTRSKRSLSRMVLEANAFAKTKHLDKIDTDSKEDKTESTPMKASKEVTSLMDVTFSPIANKSILQSSTESFLSITTEKTAKSNDDDSNIQPLPAFTTINEIYTEKSVLHSYQSSVGETTQDEMKDETVPQSELKTLPTFTTINEDINKSVLHSFESSAGETSLEDNKIPETKLPTVSFKFNETDVGKSVLGSNDNSAAITDDSIKDKNLNESSLMTSDSEIEIKDTWKSQVETQETARVIQKEKERIVEIEREINEIEGEMSDECRVESDSSEAAEDSSESDESESSEDNDSSSDNEEENEVISIADSDESSDGNALEIVDEPQVAEEIEELNEKELSPSTETKSVEQKSIQVEEKSDPKEMATETVAEDAKEQLNQACNMSILTEDNSVSESDQSVSLNYSDENKVETEEQKDEKIEENKMEEETAENKMEEDTEENKIEEDIADNKIEVDTAENKIEADTAENKMETDTAENKMEADTAKNKMKEDTAENKMEEDTAENKKEDVVAMESDQPAEIIEEIKKPQPQSSTENLPIVSEHKEIIKETDAGTGDLVDAVRIETAEIEKAKEQIANKEEVSPPQETIQDKKETDQSEKAKAVRSRKRTKSTTSNKSIDEIEQAETKTPERRKRTTSTSSNKSETEQKTPENVNVEVTTPSSRRRSKTPSTEVRKILTRRASKELMEKGEDESIILEDALTPRRRSTRSRSKKDDDNASVASESSVKSSRSKVSEEGSEAKGPVRKGRKSILQTKPDLSVIPEVITEESKGETSEDIVKELGTRRLTRNQKAVLESWLEPRTPRRRPSTASRSEVEDDDDTSNNSSDVQSIDRISLLNKADFEGSPDPDELKNSPDSTFDSKPRSRLARAASETKTIKKAARITRRTSVDIAGISSSPSASPQRARRASFARACEALHTPKGRRTSTDARKDETTSQQGSPVETPSRKTQHADTSQVKESASRSRKTSEKNKESKE